MTRIRVLPDELVNRIAAGEVVERPSSVVKELIENSLDADATRVEVELEGGGRSLVRVVDDGCGMDGDDALLALERHATSKIGAAADLERIATLGFRGEALPSIAAVSRMRLHSCADPGAGGVRVAVEGGRIVAVEGAARARGTTVEVRELFFNTPARRKFLHAPETELRHAQEAVWGAALARPEVSFVLRHGGRTLLEAPPEAGEAERFATLLRRRRHGPVCRGLARGEAAEVEVLLALGGAGRPRLTLLVNRRPVRDRLLVGAVLRTLRGAAAGGARVALHVRLAPERVDVNVHPAKAEVRFARGGAVFALVERAVGEALVAAHGEVAPRRVEAVAASSVAEPGPRYAGRSGEAHAVRRPLFEHPAWGPADEGEVASLSLDPHRPGVTGARPGSGPREGRPDTPFGRLIGQYRASFVLLEDEHGLLVVDQHVAHERVLYDRIRRRLDGAPVSAQRLLSPLLLELEEPLVTALPRVLDVLRAVGVEAAAFGPRSVRVEALPPELAPEDGAALVEEVLERATTPGRLAEGRADELADETAASLACRAAVKVNHPLSAEEQRALVHDLAASDDPYRCPHGRPIVLRVSEEEIERRLGRR